MCGWHEHGVHRLLGIFLATVVVQAPVRALADDAEPDDESDERESDETENDEDGEDAEELEAVRVQGRLGTTTSELQHRHPASVVAVDIDESVPPSATVADLLDDVAGVHVRSFGGPGAPAYVSVRGSSARQVEVWVDGVPLNAQGSASVNLAELPLRSFDRVEIFRGGAPPELGASPVGGVVHLTTKPGAVPPPSIEAGFGSWLSRRARISAGAGGDLASGGVGDIRLFAEYEGSEGDFLYFDDGGTNQGLNRFTDDRLRNRANNASDRFSGSMQARATHGIATFTLADRFLLRDAGEPGSGRSRTEEAAFGVRENLVSGRLSLAPRPGVTATGDVSWRVRGELWEDPLGEVGVGTQITRDVYHQLVPALSAVLSPIDPIAVLPSVRTVVDLYRPVNLQAEGSDEALRVRAATTLSVGFRLRPLRDHIEIHPAIGLFLLDNSALGTIPYEDIPIVHEDRDVVTVAAMPRVALALRPVPQLTIRGGVSRGFRPPSFLELFGDRGRVIGNTGLLPETSVQADGAVRVQGSPHPWFRGSFEVGGFWMRAQDQIIFVQNSQRTSYPINLGATRTSGIEAAAALLAFEHLDVAAAVTWTDSEILEAVAEAHIGSRAPGIPRWEVDLTAAVVFAPWVRVGGAWRFTAGTFDSPSNLFEQAPRSIVDVNVRIQPDARAPWFAFELRNLTDNIMAPRQRDPTQSTDDDDRIVVPVTDYRGYPLAGRSFFLSIGWTIPSTPLGLPSPSMRET